MSDSPKSSKPLVLGVVGAVVLAAIAGGYYVGVNTYKSKMQTQVTKIVNDANTASKTYLNGDFVLMFLNQKRMSLPILFLMIVMFSKCSMMVMTRNFCQSFMIIAMV